MTFVTEVRSRFGQWSPHLKRMRPSLLFIFMIALGVDAGRRGGGLRSRSNLMFGGGGNRAGNGDLLYNQ